jgi:hypothetical protein
MSLGKDFHRSSNGVSGTIRTNSDSVRLLARDVCQPTTLDGIQLRSLFWLIASPDYRYADIGTEAGAVNEICFKRALCRISTLDHYDQNIR